MSSPRPISWRITCPSCPWQVEGQLEDGRWFYFRHRFCSLQLGVGPTLDEAVLETFNPATHVIYHEDNAAECPGNGYCSGIYGEEAAYVWELAWRERAANGVGTTPTQLPPLRSLLPQQRSATAT